MHTTYADLTFDYGAGEIAQLVALFNHTVCNRTWDHLCVRGSVQPDNWTASALALQRTLVHNVPVSRGLLVGTHNSFNDRADGYGEGDLLVEAVVRRLDPNSAFIWAQQEYTMTDQLIMGVRALHLDPHYFAGEVRLCHGGLSWPWLNDFIALAEKYFNITIDAGDQDLGCTPLDRTLQAGLAELRAWLDANPRELLFIHWDDQGYTFNLTQQVEAIINDTLGPLLFLPADLAKFSNGWPSPAQIFALNKSVIIQAQDAYGAYSMPH